MTSRSPTRSRRLSNLKVGLLLAGVLLVRPAMGEDRPADGWSDAELARLKSLWIENLEPVRPSDVPTNRFAFVPYARVLGDVLFHDEGFSKDGRTACVTCHDPDRGFADGRLVEVPGIGPRNPPSLIGVGRHTFFFSDGRKDSLWSQAIGPLTSPNELGLSARDIALYVAERHGALYEKAFGERVAKGRVLRGDLAYIGGVVANVGKAIAAFELTIEPEESVFDRYVARLVRGETGGQTIMSVCATEGLRHFIGKGLCINCHNGPLMTNYHFHNTGVPLASVDDTGGGRFAALDALGTDRFNCFGPFGDGDAAVDCAEVSHAGGIMVGAYKTPTLRGIGKTAPYMHNGSLKTLGEVLKHYNSAQDGPVGSSELVPLRLTKQELVELECFLKTL